MVRRRKMTLEPPKRRTGMKVEALRRKTMVRRKMKAPRKKMEAPRRKRMDLG